MKFLNYRSNYLDIARIFSLVGYNNYQLDIEDILIQQSVSEVLGTTSIALNSGDVQSSGLELELGFAPLFSFRGLSLKRPATSKNKTRVERPGFFI